MGLCFLFSTILWQLASAQTNKTAINFQALARDNAANPALNKSLHIKISILENSANRTLLFREEQEALTDNTGVFSIGIGLGVYKEGMYSSIEQINWSNGPHALNVQIAIPPNNANISWVYQNEWIDLGTIPFGVVPYALYALNGNKGVDSSQLSLKLNKTDTAAMLAGYVRNTAVIARNELDAKLNISDTAMMLNGYVLKPYFQTQLNNLQAVMATKLAIADTAAMLSDRIGRDTAFLSASILLKENLANKSTNVADVNDFNDTKYPTVRAIKTYVDAAVVAGAPDADRNTKGILQLAGDLTGTAANPTIATDAITTLKILNGAITNDKIATGIDAAKMGLGNLTNHAQVYSINGLTTQVQNLGITTAIGNSPNWSSTTATHTLSIPMASNNGVIAGLISKTDYDHFNAAYSNNINVLSTNGNSGLATLSGTTLNIPQYSLDGLAGTKAANLIYAGPSTGAAATPSFRSLVSADIPNNAANTSGNANTATALSTARNINNIAFDGTTDITIQASSPNALSFNNTGTAAISGTSFDGSVAKTISYNTIGAAPETGSNSIVTVGVVANGTWQANKIGNNYGGAGTLTGLLKANNGVVAVADAGTDFQAPLGFATPLSLSAGQVSIAQSSSSSNGFLSSTDWTSFNNKIDASQKGSSNGVASLDINGKIPSNQIPAISFSTGVVVSSQAAMLAIPNAVTGTIAIRTDDGNNYVLSGLPGSTLSNWLQLAMPASIQAVNGQTGNTISLTTDHIGEGSTNKYFSNALARNAINAITPLIWNANSGTLSITAASASNNGYLSSTDWNNFNNKQAGFGSQNANSFYASPDGAAGTPVFRTIVGADIPTLNQNTTGTAANITASSNTSLQSLANLNTVGTIQSGTWSASVIDGLNGGTGVANAGKTITLGGNLATAGSLSFTGAYATELRTTGPSSVFLPRSGLLATVNGMEDLTQKTVNGLIFTTAQTGFTIGGGNVYKLLTVNDNTTLSGTNTGDQTITLTGDITGSGTATFNTSLASTGVTAATYGSASAVPVLNIDAKGRIISASTTSISGVSTIGSSLSSGNIIVGSASNLAASLAMSGDISINNLGATSIGNSKVTNTMLAGSIAAAKLIGTDINTLGTIGAGTWNGSIIGGQYGGTGVNNTGKTITLGGNIITGGAINTAAAFSTIGANAITLNTTTTANITLPGSGTLATLSGVEILANKQIANASTINSLGDITAKRYLSTIPTAVTAAATTSLDLSTGNVLTVNLGVNITTLNIANAAAGTYLIKFKQDATGSRDVSFPAAWKWAGGVVPNLTNTANKIDIVTLIYDGTTFYATIVQNF